MSLRSESELKKCIDAPVGVSRKTWTAQLARFAIHCPIPIGKGKVIKTGKDVTIVTYGRMVDMCLKATKMIENENDNSIY